MYPAINARIHIYLKNFIERLPYSPKKEKAPNCKKDAVQKAEEIRWRGSHELQKLKDMVMKLENRPIRNLIFREKYKTSRRNLDDAIYTAISWTMMTSEMVLNSDKELKIVYFSTKCKQKDCRQSATYDSIYRQSYRKSGS